MRNLAYKKILLIALAVWALGLSSLMAEEKAPEVMLKPDELKWVEGPPSIPPGARMALIEGALTDPVPFTFRLKLPPDYKIPPHTHPAIEHVTVISGTLRFGSGEKTVKSIARAFPAGSVIVMAAGKAMFGWTEEETVIQVHGIGPWGINYVNPADDPRKK